MISSRRPSDGFPALRGFAPQPETDRTPVARGEERRETDWIALIHLPDTAEIPCELLNVSSSGARIGIPRRYPLPARFVFQVIEQDLACLARLVWRRADAAGVRIERVGPAAELNTSLLAS